MEAPQTDWEAHYRQADTPWDKGAPSPALLEALERLAPKGRVLVPGCGLGHDVRALARAGLSVVGLDIAPAAVAAASALPRVGGETYVCGDLFELAPDLAGAFDLVWEHTCYCAIPRERRPDYVRGVARALRPGGALLGVFYLDPGQALASDGPPFETTLASLDRHFAPHFHLWEEWAPHTTYPGRENREWVRLYRRS